MEVRNAFGREAEKKEQENIFDFFIPFSIRASYVSFFVNFLSFGEEIFFLSLVTIKQ